MLIIGCDFHTRYQQIAMMDEVTGELTERRLDHESGEAHALCSNSNSINILDMWVPLCQHGGWRRF